MTNHSSPLSEKPSPLRLSQLISHALRHHPDRFGVTLDVDGFASFADLVAGLSRNCGQVITDKELAAVIQEYGEGRFLMVGDRIRAQYGHTVEGIIIEFTSLTPPEFLYHGTLSQHLGNILRQGLLKHNHSHVHLSDSMEEAETVGSRRGESVVLIIKARNMANAGYQFFQVNDSVWLTETVPAAFLDVT